MFKTEHRLPMVAASFEPAEPHEIGELDVTSKPFGKVVRHIEKNVASQQEVPAVSVCSMARPILPYPINWT